MVKRNGTKEQTMIYKTLHRKLNIEHDPYFSSANIYRARFYFVFLRKRDRVLTPRINACQN
jgi:hypothetical protein